MLNYYKLTRPIFTPIIWLLSVIAVVLIFVAPANAAPSALPKSCDFSSASDFEIPIIFEKFSTAQKQDSSIICGSQKHDHIYSWAYYGGLSEVSSKAEPLEFRMSIHRRTDQSIFVRYDDGMIAQSPTRMSDAKKTYSWGELAYALPQNDRIITDILVKTENSQSERGAALAGKLVTANHGASDDIFSLIVYVLMAGVVMTLLPLTLILFMVSRRRFLLAYAASLVMILLSGVFWSGAATLVYPSMDVGVQEQLSALTIGLYGLCQVALMMTTFRDDMRYKRIEKILLSAGAIATIGQIIRIFAPEFEWRLINDIVYLSLATLVVGLYLCALVSARRGSMVARLYSFVWAIPFVVASVRIAWGLDLFTGYDKYILVSPLFMLFGEGILGAFVIGWQFNMLRNERDIAKGREAALITLSESDSLTGLLNRRAFLNKATEGHHQKSLILIDIDHFKTINDRYGHAIGDDTIRYVADIMTEIAPHGSLIGRLGGEEFGILVHASDAGNLAQKLCEMVALPRDTSQCPPVTISCGVARGHIRDEKDWRLLYIAADNALYQSKNSGRNQVQMAIV